MNDSENRVNVSLLKKQTIFCIEKSDD